MKLPTAILCTTIILLGASIQTNREDPHRVRPIMEKLAKIDKANRVLPLLLTKEQARKLLIEIEKCRVNIRNQEKKEADRLKAMEKEIDDVLADATKGVVPSQEFLKKVNDLFKQFESERNAVRLANSLILKDQLEAILDAGQRRAMSKVVDQIYTELGYPLEGVSENEKTIYFAMDVLLDDLGYQFLVDLSAAR